mmetsp:Transcript_104504/g.337031  ORF Transcript_104504/g.337031 Transcript_104504/m.337031 type:complete len:207 (+) Transcript_104504:404-1024(+)
MKRPAKARLPGRGASPPLSHAFRNRPKQPHDARRKPMRAMASEASSCGKPPPCLTRSSTRPGQTLSPRDSSMSNGSVPLLPRNMHRRRAGPSGITTSPRSSKYIRSKVAASFLTVPPLVQSSSTLLGCEHSRQITDGSAQPSTSSQSASSKHLCVEISVTSNCHTCKSPLNEATHNNGNRASAVPNTCCSAGSRTQGLGSAHNAPA